MMGEETSNVDENAMNNNLNLNPDSSEPLSGPALSNEAMILGCHHHLDHHDFPEFQIVQSESLYSELDELLANSENRSELQAGEGIVVAEERAGEVPKASEIGNGGVAELNVTSSENKANVEKEGGGGNDAGFFYCYICVDMAKDPVVTCCGHLFCWPCLYKWLHLRSSNTKQCPACKGEVNVKNVTPIYGHGNDTRVHKEEEQEGYSDLKIPPRPNARRVESRLNLYQELIHSHEFLGDRAFRRDTRIQNPLGRRRNHQQPASSVEDRDSFSSVAAVIISDSQVDSASEIDSMVHLSTSSSRRRNYVSTSASDDVDSGDSHSPRRRRLN